VVTGHSYIGWLSLVALACLYNSWVIPLRCFFPYQTPENTPIWLTVDFCADMIYLIDMAVIQPRVMFISQGLWVNDRSQMRRNYLTKIEFKVKQLFYFVINFHCLFLDGCDFFDAY
jgi:hypothetical protein